VLFTDETTIQTACWRRSLQSAVCCPECAEVGLAHDPITNVRFCCARFLKKCLWPKQRYRQNHKVLEAVERLKNDDDDVEIRRFGALAVGGGRRTEW